MNSHSSSLRPTRRISIKGFQLSNSSDFEEMSSILEKVPISRSELDIIRLQKTFMGLFSFFEKLEAEASDAAISTLIREMSIEFHPRMKPLFKIGDSGTKFYLILKGSVYVLAREKGLESMSKNEPEHSPINLKSGSSLSIDQELVNSLQKSSPLARQQSIKFDKIIGKVRSITKMRMSICGELNDEEILLIQYPDLYIDRVMARGEAFGELALRHKEAKRMATIVCKEDCYFGVISKSIFQRALQSHFDRVMSHNLLFFRKHPLFSEWNPLQLEQFYQHVNIRTFVKNQMVYQEGEASDCFYLIKEGEIEISKKIERKIEVKSKNEEFRIMIHKIAGSKPKKNTFSLRVSLLQKGQIFGLEELVVDKPRLYQAQCISASATTYYIAKEKFLAYASDFATLAKVLEIKKNIEFYRKDFIENNKEFLVSTPLPNEKNIQLNNSPKYKKEEEPELINRGKFDGKLHCFHSQIDYLGEKSKVLFKKAEENRSFLEKNRVFFDVFEPKENKTITKPNPRPFMQDSYMSIIKYPKRSSERTHNFDSFFSKSRFSNVNLLDFSEETEEKNEILTERRKKSKNLKKTTKKMTEFEHYFPVKVKKTAEKRLKLPSLSLSGTSLMAEDSKSLIGNKCAKLVNNKNI